MAFQVYENDKPCNSYGFKNWGQDTFEKKRDAEIYAYAWSYPYSFEESVCQAPSMIVGQAYNYGISEHPVMMKIIEV